MSKGLSSVKTLTAKEIAKKWNLPLSVVAKKIAAGVKVEKEHTKSTRQASEIARDHLGERPDYYDKLDKMEKQPVKEETTTTGVGGLGFVTGTPAVDEDNEYVNTNSMAYNDVNGNNLNYVEKSHRKLHDRNLGFKEFDPKKIKTNSNKDLAESLGSDYGTTSVRVIGDLTGSSRKVSKVDEVKLPPKARKAVATGMTLANLYTAGDVASRAQQGIGSPMKDIVTAASTLPGTKGWSAYGADKARQAYEYIKGKRMKENKNLVPANTTERGIYEATFQGKKVPLNKRLPGDVKKSKVFVDPDGDGKAQKVNFGDPNMTIKKSNPARRKSFRARHNCDNPGPKTKARYWSCKAWEETQIDEMRSSRNPSRAYAIRRSANAKYEPDEIAKKYPNWRGFSSDKENAELKARRIAADAESRRRYDEKHGKKEKLDETSLKKKITYAVRAAGQQSRIAKELRPDKVESDKTFQKRKKGLDRVFKESSQIDELSAELVGKVSNARFWRGEAPSKTLSRAINKKYIESGKKKDTKTNTKEETTMDTKDLINEALDNILEENLVAMRENLQTALQEKMMEKLEERKKIIASDYFAQ